MAKSNAKYILKATVSHCVNSNNIRSKYDKHKAHPHSLSCLQRGVCPGQRCSVMLTDCRRVSRIMEKLSFCNAQMRLSLVLQLSTGSRRDAVSNRGSIQSGNAIRFIPPSLFSPFDHELDYTNRKLMLLIVVGIDMFILLYYREQRGKLKWICYTPSVYVYI